MVIVGFALMFLGVGYFIAAFGVALTAFRKVVDFQFERHREIWVRDGRPVGGKATRSEVSFLGSEFAAALCFQRWLIQRPDWLEAGSDGEAYRVRMARWSKGRS